MRIKFLLTTLFLTAYQLANACDVCDKQQPKITAGFTHGVGPTSNWDWVNISIIAGFTLFTLFFSIKYLVAPGEKSNDHIKRKVLTNSESNHETR